MTPLRSLAVLFFSLCVAACGGDSEAAAKEGNAALKDLPGVLQTIKDPATAEAARQKLQGIAQKLQNWSARAQDAANEGAGKLEDAAQKLGKMASDAFHKSGLDQKAMAKIDELLADPQIREAVGPTLLQLKAALQK